MKKTVRVVAAFLCAALFLLGCGEKEKAEDFLYRTLDERLQGDASQVEGRTETERVYQDHTATVVFFTDAFLLGDMKADDAERESFDKISEKILASARYRVTGAKKKKGFWAVSVEICPDRIFVSARERLRTLSEKTEKEAMEIPEEKREEFMTETYLAGAKKILGELSESPVYGEKRTVVVKVRERDGKKIISDEEWTLFLSKLFVLS